MFTLWTPRVPNGKGLLVLLSTNKTSASKMRSSPEGKAFGMNSEKCCTWKFKKFITVQSKKPGVSPALVE